MQKGYVFLGFLVLLLTTVSLTRFQAGTLVGLKEAETEVPVLDEATASLVHQYDAFVRESLQREQFPGTAVVIVKDGAVIFKQCYGVRTANTTDSVNVNTLFRLASLSKGFASVLAGMLVQDGYFEWDDPVKQYVPGFSMYRQNYTDSLSVRHVLSHTTGLPRQTYSNLIERDESYASARYRLREVKPTHPLGKHYNYQNVTYSLIGDIAEKTTGKRFEELLYQRIFLPLRMINAGAGYNNFLLDTFNVAWPHRIENEQYKRIKVLPNYYEVMPAAGVNASISDMGEWLRFLLGHRPDLMNKEALNELFNKQVNVPLAEGNHRSYPEALEAWYGMGWRGIVSNERRVIFHGGYVNGFRSEIAFIPSEDIGIAILSNSPSWFINSSVPRFLQMYWGLPYEQN